MDLIQGEILNYPSISEFKEWVKHRNIDITMKSES